MTYESLKEFYGGILGLTEEWEVETVIRDPKEKMVQIIIEHSNSSSGQCPLCGKIMPMHDKKSRRWRHLDSCNHKTFIEADILRINCSKHGVHQIIVPWAQKNSRFTIELEMQVFLWLKGAMISAVA